MVNKKAKGTAIEKEAKDVFLGMGWNVWKPGRMARRLPGGRFISVPQDIADVFDFMIWNKREIRFVQVKSNPSDVSKAKRDIIAKKFPDIPGVTYEIMSRIKGRPGMFRMYIYRRGLAAFDYTGEYGIPL